MVISTLYQVNNAKTVQLLLLFAGCNTSKNGAAEG